MSALTCSHLKKSYGSTTVIEDFNLTINDGEFIVFLGPSGCGKSTMLRMLAGLEEISGGDLLIDGARVNDLEPSARGVAMVFQNYALYPHMSIFDNIAFGLRRQRLPENEIKNRVDQVAAMLRLEPYLDRKPAQLSGGQQQRVAIARAMIKTPKLFLFDEPLSNLDAKLRHHMRTEIAKLHRTLKATTIYVTHDQLEAMTLADRIVLMRDGQIEQVGTPQELYNAPANQFVADFIGVPSMNFITCPLRGQRAKMSIDLKGIRLCDSFEHKNLKGLKSVLLGVRPQHLHIATKDAAIVFEGVVETVEFQGDSKLVSVRLDQDLVLSAMMSPSAEVVPGAWVQLGAEQSTLRLFDPETLNALPHSP